MVRKLLMAGTIFCGTGVALGALGAHALKETLDPGSLNSFETAVRYQLVHGLGLLVIALVPFLSEASRKILGRLFITGILLFSGSIYILSTQALLNIKASFLGPVTPVGGLLLISGWFYLSLKIFQYKSLKD